MTDRLNDLTQMEIVLESPLSEQFISVLAEHYASVFIFQMQNVMEQSDDLDTLKNILTIQANWCCLSQKFTTVLASCAYQDFVKALKLV